MLPPAASGAAAAGVGDAEKAADAKAADSNPAHAKGKAAAAAHWQEVKQYRRRQRQFTLFLAGPSLLLAAVAFRRGDLHAFCWLVFVSMLHGFHFLIS